MTAARLELVPGAPRIAVEHAGHGQGVIFLHGIGGNRTNWRDQIAELAEQFHCAAWDARGYGDSDDPIEGWDFPAFSADLLRVIDHLRWDRAHVVGLSMGGRIAQDFYARHPERVRSLVLCGTYAGQRPNFGPADREEFLRLRKQPLLEGKRPCDIAPTVASTLLGSRAGEEQRRRLIESLSALRTTSYLKALDVVTRYDVDCPLTEIRVPVLLVFGEEDRLTPPALGRHMHGEIEGSRLECLARTGHMVNIEDPETFNRIIKEFLRAASAC